MPCWGIFEFYRCEALAAREHNKPQPAQMCELRILDSYEAHRWCRPPIAATADRGEKALPTTTRRDRATSLRQKPSLNANSLLTIFGYPCNVSYRTRAASFQRWVCVSCPSIFPLPVRLGEGCPRRNHCSRLPPAGPSGGSARHCPRPTDGLHLCDCCGQRRLSVRRD